jgi:hypothetical protein
MSTSGSTTTPPTARGSAPRCRPDPEWQAFLKLSAEAGYLVAQENRLLTPAPFFRLAR